MNLLFLCASNTARSISAKALLNVFGGGRSAAYCAGSQPRGHVHPLALELFAGNRMPVAGLLSKDWREFAT